MKLLFHYWTHKFPFKRRILHGMYLNKKSFMECLVQKYRLSFGNALGVRYFCIKSSIYCNHFPEKKHSPW